MGKYDRPIVTSRRPVLGLRYGLHWAHKAPGGRSCLRDAVSWRTISGVSVNTPWGSAWVMFRRWRFDRSR